MYCGYRYFKYLRQGSTDVYNDQQRLELIVAAALGALIGSRIIGVLEEPQFLLNSPDKLSFILGNKTIVGGFFGGLLVVEVYKKIKGLQFSSGDLMTFPLILALIIGRIGCFLAGLSDNTYGIPGNFWFCIDMGDGIPRHPTNLYEIGFLLFISGILYLLGKYSSLKDGAMFKIFLASYFLMRFFIEFIKPHEFLIYGISVIQMVCIAGLLYYYRVILFPLSLIKRNA